MMQFWGVFLFVLLLLTSCQPGQTPVALTAGRDGAQGFQTASVALNIVWPTAQTFAVQAIPAGAEELQLEITDADSRENLYRALITKADVKEQRVTKQIRLDLRGRSSANVIILVSVRNALRAVIASARQNMVLKAGEINRARLKVELRKDDVVIIGGGGGGGGGGGVTPTPTPLPSVTPTPGPTTYSITPELNTFYVDINQSFSLDFKVWNGQETGYLWAMTGTSGLPAGLAFTSASGGNVDGVPLLGFLSVPNDTITLRGTTTQEGVYPFTLSVVNGEQTTQRTYNLVVRSLQIVPDNLPAPVANSPYDQPFQALYGTGPYTWSHTGTLPPGLSLTPGNTDVIRLSGTPTSAINADTYSFKLKVTDSLNRSAEQTYVLGCGDGATFDYLNAQPIVNSVSPESGSNQVDQVMTISGSNFMAGSLVFLDKMGLKVLSQNGATQMTVRVPAGMKPGTYNLIVINPDSTVGRIEGGLSNAYRVEDAGGFVSAPPGIGAVYLRGQPILPSTTQQELLAQLLTYQTQMIPGRSLNQDNLDFVPLLLQGQNFTPDSLAYISELILPGFYVSSSQMLVIVPLKLLFADIPGTGSLFVGYNKIVVVNPNLEMSEPDQGRFSLSSANFAAENGEGVGYISYVYPQKGFDNENNRLVVKGCGFERTHSMTITNKLLSQRTVELPSVFRAEVTSGMVFPNTLPYDFSLFRTVNLQSILSDTAPGVFTVSARQRKLSSSSPAAIVPNRTMAINLTGAGLESGIQVQFIRHGGSLDGTVYNSPASAVQSSLKAWTIAPGSLPRGEYKLRVTWPDGFIYTTPETVLTVATQAAQPAPVISSITPTSVSNGILDPGQVVEIVINGAHFQNGAAIYIGPKQALSGTGSENKLTINSDTVYGMPPGTYPVQIVNPDGQSTQTSFAVTVTDGGAEILSAPEIFDVFPANPYKSMHNPYPDAAYLYFQASSILAGSYVQLVSHPDDPFNPQDAFLDGIVVMDASSGAVRGTLPYLRAGTYYLRMINADGQMHTSTVPIVFQDSRPPEIETNLVNLQLQPECKQSICPASWPNSSPVSLTVNGLYMGVYPNFSGLELVSVNDSSVVIRPQNVTSYGNYLVAGLLDGLAPGEYRVRIVNPDGQTSDAVNTGDKEVRFTILDSVIRWSRAQRMPNISDPGALPALHGRVGASALTDPDTGKIYFFAGNDARKDYNHLTRTLLSYSETSAWVDLSASVPATLTRRLNHAAVWKNGANFNQDRMFIYGGTTWSCPGAPPASCATAINPSVLDDLWMYRPAANTWGQLTISGPKQQLTNARMHWNPANNSLYLYGGVTASGQGVLGTSYNDKIFRLAVDENNLTAAWTVVTPLNAGPTESALVTVSPPLPDCYTVITNKPCAWVFNEMLSDPEHSRFFVYGGWKVNSQIANGIYPMNEKVWMFDVSSNKWAEIEQSGVNFTGRANFAHGFDPVNHRLYVYGGNTSYSGPTPSALTLTMNVGTFANFEGNADDPPTLVWTEELALPIEARYSHAASWSNGRFYVFGGLNQDGVRLYDPASPIDPLASGHTYYTDIWQYIP
jgi:hypothetical protein